VKFLSPIVIGGLPLPGCEPPPPEELELVLDPELPPDAELDEELELPHAASTPTAHSVPRAASARLICNFITFVSLAVGSSRARTVVLAPRSRATLPE
jgi:hypothetical protein